MTTTASDTNDKDINDLLFGNQTPVWAFPDDGKVKEIRGRIILISKTHKRKYDPETRTSKEPMYWQADGSTGIVVTDKPMYEPVLTLQTAFRAFEGVKKPGEPGTDDGLRRVWVTSRSVKNPGSVKDALVAACVKARSLLHAGDYFSLKRVSGRGNVNSPFVHSGEYFPAATPPDWSAETLVDESVSVETDLFDE